MPDLELDEDSRNWGFDILRRGTKDELEEIFLSMQDEIFQKFGISQNYQDYLMLLKQKAVILEQLTENFDPFLNLDLEVINDDIKTLTENGTRQDFDEVIIIIEKFMSFQLDPKKVSVKKYYSYLKTIEKHGKAD